MATPQFIQDFGRLPTQRKVLSFVVAAALLGGLYFQFVFKGLKQDLEEAQAEHDTKLGTNKQLEANIADYEKLKAGMPDLQRIIDCNQAALPTEAELPAFFETLNRKVNAAGVEISRWKQLKEEPIETFIKVPIEIEMTGTFMQIKRFFASLVPAKKDGKTKGCKDKDSSDSAEQDRIISVDNITITNPQVKNREIVLTARFVAVTYRQEEKKAEPPKPGTSGAAPSGAPTAPKAGGTATPPMPTAPTPTPGAGTPKGAQIRTEDAIEKGAQRNANAAGVEEAKTPSGSDRLKGGK